MSKWILPAKWIGLLMPVLLVCALCLPWIFKLVGIPTTGVGIANSFIRRLFTSPDSYLPVLLVLLIVIAIAIWPGNLRPHRSLVVAGIFWGLGLAIMWGFDGGLGNLLLIAGSGLLSFGAMDYGLSRIKASSE